MISLSEVAGWPASIGHHRVFLEVFDGVCSGSTTVDVRVVTPAGGVLRCIKRVNQARVPRKIKRSLT